MIFPIYIPTMNEKPPTVYSILNSIVNFDSDDKTKIPDLSKSGRHKIFDFDYPLSDKISKESFEVMILNKFLMRRIGYETVTAFKIALNVKLNEIMPMYNKMFDMLQNWDIFNDGEDVMRTVSEEKNSNGSLSNTTNSTNSTDVTSLENSSNSSTNSNNSDRRYSEMPENSISDVKDGKYITNYNYDVTNDSNNSTLQSNVSNSTNSESETINNSTSTNKDNNNLIEKTTRTPSDKMKLYSEFINNRNSIYTMIFKELDSLFYGLA